VVPSVTVMGGHSALPPVPLPPVPLPPVDVVAPPFPSMAPPVPAPPVEAVVEAPPAPGPFPPIEVEVVVVSPVPVVMSVSDTEHPAMPPIATRPRTRREEVQELMRRLYTNSASTWTLRRSASAIDAPRVR